MTTAAINGYGATFGKMTSAGPPAVFTNYAELLTLSLPSPTLGTEQATHMGSPDGTHEYIPTLVDPGEVTATMNYTKAGYALLLSDVNGRLLGTYKGVLPEGSSLLFNGIPTGATIDEVGVEGVISMSATYKVSGRPVFTAAT